MADIAKPLPQSLEAERAILGAALVDSKCLDDAGELQEGDFFIPQHVTIFKALRDLAENHEPIDLVSMMDHLQVSGELAAIGGVAYLSQLSDGMAKITNVGHYAKIVKAKSVARQAIHLAEKIQLAAMEGGENETVLDTAIQGFMELALDGSGIDKYGKSYFDAAVSLVKSLEDKNRKRVLSGLYNLDRATGGFLGGELITLTASTGVGKTLIAQQIRRYACEQGLHTLYCSGEMTGEHLVSRELATEASVDRWKMRRPEKITEEDFKSLVAATAHECQKCCILDGELSVRSIRVAARRKKKATGLDAVILDYDELIDAPGKNELEQQRNLVRAAKSIGVELNVPVLMISQLRKPSKDNQKSKDATKPTLENIYGSGSKSKHSSWILYLDRPFVRNLEGDETEAALYILKARDGRVNKFKLKFNINSLRFTEPLPEIP